MHPIHFVSLQKFLFKLQNSFALLHYFKLILYHVFAIKR